MDSAVTQYLYKYNIAQNFHFIKMQFTFSIGSMQIKIGGGGGVEIIKKLKNLQNLHKNA